MLLEAAIHLPCSVQGSVVGCCKYDAEDSGTKNVGKFLK